MSKVLQFKSRGPTAAARFEALMRPHFAAVYAAASRLTSSPADAEDLVQEVCVKAWLNLSEFAEMQFQRAWLVRTLYNHFIDDKRRHQRSPVHLAWRADSGEDIEHPGPENLQPDREVERIMRIESIFRAMRLLGKEQCMLLALHDIDGFSLNELQVLTDLPVGTLKSKLHRARVKLGRLLQKADRAEACNAQTGTVK
ncbi:MAG: sigma-70 family RNA polymerase sigma factor [Woeseia sp.]